MNYITSQFGNPRGLIGHLAGLIMAYENRARNQWALSLLDIQPTDRILEIGFGPGWAIRQASKVAVNGTVAGIDRSRTMVRQATIRNRTKVKSGHVILQHGTAARLPFDDRMFDKAYAVNSFHEWEDPVRGLQEIRRILFPAGHLLIVEHPHGAVNEQDIVAWSNQLASQLQDQGFESIQSFLRFIQGRTAVALSAQNP